MTFTSHKSCTLNKGTFSKLTDAEDKKEKILKLRNGRNYYYEKTNEKVLS